MLASTVAMTRERADVGIRPYADPPFPSVGDDAYIVPPHLPKLIYMPVGQGLAPAANV